MVSQYLESPFPSVGSAQPIYFAGHGVNLAGQLDYPATSRPSDGYPLLFTIQHATCNTRKGYAHLTKLGTEIGHAVFRWDKRGTGSSGSGGGGSAIEDIQHAYETAVRQPGIDPNRVTILAQSEGTLQLRDAYQKIRQIQQPRSVILSGNMLDEHAILRIDVPVHIIVSKNDWNAWQIYAEAAADKHASKYGYTASFYVATNTNRLLMYTNGGTFHRGAAASIRHWLTQNG